MDEETAIVLSRYTSAFYETCAESFSKTRSCAWAGWTHGMKIVEERQALIDSWSAPDPKSVNLWSWRPADKTYSVLDIGSGNFRFEKFLIENFPSRSFEFTCIDSCDHFQQIPECLLDSGAVVDMRKCDIVSLLSHGQHVVADEDARKYDLVVAFGIFHHIPLASWRRELIMEVASALRKNGCAICTFWQIESDDALSKKAARMSNKFSRETGIALDVGAFDYILGWQDMKGVYRFCHGFTADEVDHLISDVTQDMPDAVGDSEKDIVEISRFYADGKNNMGNIYTVLQRIR